MFIFKKPEPVLYHSHATDADFKFRQANERERKNLFNYSSIEGETLFVDVNYNKDEGFEEYHAAWLLEDFSGVETNGKTLSIKDFSLRDKADLIRQLKKTDTEFWPWFKVHCEPAEKKTSEIAASGEMVGPGSVQDVQE